MPLHPVEVSVTSPIERAIAHTRRILFSPFALDKWLRIGFCAFLATLGRGGFGFNYSAPMQGNNAQGGGRKFQFNGHDVRMDFAHGRAFIMANLYWIVPLAISLFVAALAVAVVIMWLRSRGEFMLLHCIANNRGEVVLPWHKYARLARSLWLFKLVLAGVGVAFFLPVAGIVAWIVFQLMSASSHQDFIRIFFPSMLGIGLLEICVGIPLFVTSFLTTALVAPIMFLKDITCTDAWRVLLSILQANVWRIVKFLLFQAAIQMVCAMIIMMFVICTCCIGGILLAIPYIGSVVLLPYTVFTRAYNLVYLAQYGADLDLFQVYIPRPPPLSSAR